jgi:1-acyl-sn-glycerol-3-phosphate acyltransferase
LFPLLVGVAAVVDLTRSALTRRPWMATRLVLFLWVFLAAEVAGLVWFSIHWVTTPPTPDRRERLVAKTWRVQTWWARTLLAAVRRLFRLELDVQDEDTAAPGPVLALFRHASIIDNLLPAVLLSGRLGLKLRWVIKRELLSLPPLDVGGKRLPNYFVDRQSDDPRGELRRIKALATGLRSDEGVLIYPEGTRFTQSRRTRALQRLARGSVETYERASRLRHVLPPRPGGVLTVLDQGYDVVICAHEGLGGFARVKDLWAGSLVGRTIHVRFWRVPAEDIPPGRSARIDWLYTQWEQIDAWIEEAKETDG